MPWPFGSSDSSAPRKDSEADKPESSRSSPLGIEPDWEHYKSMKNWLPTVLVTVAALSALTLYRSYLRRYPTTAHIPPELFRKRSLFGRVTSVGDGDNFHFFHTPGGRLAGWEWLRRVPESKAELKNQTIPIRLAGVDAPEGAHFGRPAQPFSGEALRWLSDYILGRRVRAYIHKRDQYERVVATVRVRRFLLFRKDVSLEMLKRGLATTYEAKTGAEFGGCEEQYKAAEAAAKSRKHGIWGTKPSLFESPREYKNRMNETENEKIG